MCPNIHLLQSYKVYPRKISFNYMKDQFFTYVYLDPFQPLDKPLQVKAGGQEYCFAYQPIYIGKGTGAGYRQNQHLSAFRNNRENNPWKVQVFKEIENNMANAVATEKANVPWNWKEYQGQFVVVLETFQDPKALLKFEMEMINTIGTLWDKSGSLANKIKNAYTFNNLSTGRDQIL